MFQAAFAIGKRLAGPGSTRLRRWLRSKTDRAPWPTADEALEAAGVGTWEWEIESGRVRWSPNIEALHGLEPGSFPGTFDAFLGLIHPDDRPDLLAALERALSSQDGYRAEYRVKERHHDPGGPPRWIEAQGRVRLDASGQPERMVGICSEVTTRKRTEELAELLADAGSAMVRSLDIQETLTAVARKLVPVWADWCVIDLLKADDRIENIVTEHRDPEQVEFLRRMRERSPPSLQDPNGTGYVIDRGEPQVFPEVPPSVMEELARDEVHLQALQELGVRSGVVVPLVAHGRSLGALTLVSAETPLQFTEQDLPRIQELANHCALAVDNARLHQQTRRELEQLVSARTSQLEERAAQLRRMTAELTRAEQRERRKLAQLLHDDHQQTLVAARMHAERLEGATDEPIASTASRLVRLLDEAVGSARSLSHELSPQVLHTSGIAAALRWLAPRMEERYGLTVHVEADESADRTGQDTRLLLFQLVRELLLNVAKHSSAKEARTALAGVEETVELVVEDRGKGFDPAVLDSGDPATTGLGLMGMRERVLALGGEVYVESAPGEGTRVTVRVPRHA